MKKLGLTQSLLIILFILTSAFNSYSQPVRSFDKTKLQVRSINELRPDKNIIDSETTIKDTLLVSETEKINCNNPESSAYVNKYRLISNYIPTEKENVKVININFNIFQNFEGKNNFSPSTNAKDMQRLNNMLAWINEIYAKQPWCETIQTFNSDPPLGVVVNDLPHKFIQFNLVGIYEYRDKTPDEGLWKSNNSRDLMKRIAETDSSRLEQLNICFTEKHYLGSVREILVKKEGKDYQHPEVIVKSKTGSGAKCFASVVNGSIKAIDLFDGGSGYEDVPEILIKGGGGRGAKAIAHVNPQTKSIQRIEVIDGGTQYKYAKIEIKGGGGNGALAYIDKISKGKIKSIYVAQRGSSYYDDPEISIVTNSQGTGAAFAPVIRGATGFTLMPWLGDADLYIIEKSLWNEGSTRGDYAAATNIAHELGHTLGLLHTYSGGSETNHAKHHDYLWDVFGYEFTGYHVLDWGKQPCLSHTDNVTNNLMGGNQTSQYTSPLQIGKMHRSLHIYNMKKYTQCNCDTNKVWTITENEVWDFAFKSYNPIIIKNGGSLTVHCTLEMPDGCNITIEKGGILTIEKNGIITGGCNKLWDGKLIVKKDAIFNVKPGGKYYLQDLGKLFIE